MILSRKHCASDAVLGALRALEAGAARIAIRRGVHPRAVHGRIAVAEFVGPVACRWWTVVNFSPATRWWNWGRARARSRNCWCSDWRAAADCWRWKSARPTSACCGSGLPPCEIIHDSAENLTRYAKPRSAQCVVSGLAWGNMLPAMQDRIFGAVLDSLAPDGQFVAFGYIHAKWFPTSASLSPPAAGEFSARRSHAHRLAQSAAGLRVSLLARLNCVH